MYFFSRFINKLRVSEGLPEVKYSGQNALRAFVALENIERFVKGAVEYGVPEESSFDSQDLYGCHKGPFANVLAFLNSLGIEVTGLYFFFFPNFNKRFKCLVN